MNVGKLEVSPGFLLLAAWLNYMDHQGLFVAGLLSCALHECGHLWALHVLGNPVERICVTVVGAEICVSRGLSYRGELFAVLMGPAVNLVLALLLCRMPGGAVLAGMNLILACFNLLPIGHMDGGRAFQCLASLLLGPARGERIAQGLSWLAALAVWVAGLAVLCTGGNLTLLLVAAWLLRGMMEKGLKRGRKSRK